MTAKIDDIIEQLKSLQDFKNNSVVDKTVLAWPIIEKINNPSMCIVKKPKYYC